MNSLQLAYAPYHLTFKHPFGTAHGIRTGTDAVFVRLTRKGISGYGEAALPPYLKETSESVIQEIKRTDLDLFLNDHIELPEILDSMFFYGMSSPSRAALSTAYYDLISREKDCFVKALLHVAPRSGMKGSPMVTLGLCNLDDIALKLSELPNSDILKVKLGSTQDKAILTRVLELDDRALFLDANQGWNDLDQVLELVKLVGQKRIVGIEQPFAKDAWSLHAELQHRTTVPVYGDESIQTINDVERAGEAFSGVNIKLMKCGGLDRAVQICDRAHELGLKVMLGCMSESSLGCGAMAQLSDRADLVDLDGPWLIGNDPFTGLSFLKEGLRCDGTTGTGVDLKEPSLLNWTPVGA